MSKWSIAINDEGTIDLTLDGTITPAEARKLASGLYLAAQAAEGKTGFPRATQDLFPAAEVVGAVRRLFDTFREPNKTDGQP